MFLQEKKLKEKELEENEKLMDVDEKNAAKNDIGVLTTAAVLYSYSYNQLTSMLC